MSTFQNTDLIAISRAGTTYKAEYGDAKANIISGAAAVIGSGNRNRLMNGDFRLARSASTTTVTGPGMIKNVIPRWQFNMDGSSGSRSIARVANPVGTLLNGVEAPYCLRYTLNTSSSGATFSTAQQRIEGVSSLSGQQVTMSFWAKASSPITIPFVLFYQNFGTGGSPSSTVLAANYGAFTVGTSWQFFTATTTTASISGKTLGSNGDDYMEFQLRLPLSPFSLDLTLVQVESGPLATPFETRLLPLDKVCTERYFQEGLGYMGAYATGAGDCRLGQIFLPTSMRAVPSIGLTLNDSLNVSSITAAQITRDSFGVFATVPAAGRVNANFSYTADSEY